MSCPPGYIRRKGYTRKNTGKHVKSTCIRSTSNKVSSTKRKKYCPPGQIARAGYTRRISNTVRRQGYTKKTASGNSIQIYPKSRSVRVKASCVKDMARSRKLPQMARSRKPPQMATIGPLRKGDLQKYGYSYKLPEIKRQVALVQAIKEYGALGTYRKLDAVSKLTVRTAPEAHKAFTKDRNWVKKAYGVNGTLKQAF